MSGKGADVVIVGGGVMGVSIAHHLAAARAGQVLLLEKQFIGAGSSGRSGAIIRQHYSTSLLIEMARAGVLTFRDFEESTGAASGWMGVGCLVVADSRDRAAAEGNVGLMRAAGAAAELCSADRIGEIAPMVAAGAGEIGAWEPEAGCVDPASVLHGYATSAAAAGVDIRCGVEVRDIELDRGRIAAVATSDGRIETRTVVLCAGPWAGRLASRAGLDLSLKVIRPEVAIHRRSGDFGAASHPIVADLPNGFYCRPMPGGCTLAGALDVAHDEVILDPDRYWSAATGQFCDWTRAQLALRMPAMERSFGRGGYSGLYTVTSDSHPILGEAPGLRGLYLAVGFSGHGFKLSPAVGRGLAELITGGYRTLDLSPLRATRFAEGEPIRGAYEYGLLS